MTIWNNPIDTVMQAANELYPDLKVFMQFDPSVRHGKFLFLRWGTHGYTNFPADKSEPQINISSKINLGRIVEVIAHEIAHAVAGYDADHGKAWQTEFDKIFDKYNEIMRSKRTETSKPHKL
jgi:predicted SnoaL-like aldol condensation-catalyzing enzyme